MPQGAIRLVAMTVALAAAGGVALAGTPPATNQLQDLPVFKDQLFGTWSGGDIVTVGTYNDQLPIDATQAYGGLPSLRFEVFGPTNWWWASILAGQDWMPYSVEHYRRSGYLEFNVKGAAGGEVFTLQVGDLDNARTPAETTLPSVGSWDYVWLTTDWQHVTHPAQRADARQRGAASRHLRPAAVAGVEVRGSLLGSVREDLLAE